MDLQAPSHAKQKMLVQRDHSYMERAKYVLDNGSFSIKIGVAGDENPTVFVKPVVGKPKIQGVFGMKKCYVGQEALSKVDQLHQAWPIEHVQHTEVAFNPKANREKMTQIMFEVFQVPEMNLTIQAVSALYASGRGSGLSIDMGAQQTSIVPVYEGQGYMIPNVTTVLPFGGEDITDLLMKLLAQSDQPLPLDKTITRDIKEKSAYVRAHATSSTTSPQASGQLPPVSTYQLPDGKILNLGEARHQCTELLFDPALIGFQGGLHQQLFSKFQDYDFDLQKMCRRQIVLSGGNSLLSGLPQRLEQELTLLLGDHRLIADNNRQNYAWVGGSILASLSTFSTFGVRKDEYEESGPAIIHQKCF